VNTPNLRELLLSRNEENSSIKSLAVNTIDEKRIYFNPS
jgi:hypothetical protein